MKSNKKSLIVPILLIVIGAGWLLTTLKIAPDIDWIWTLGLAVIGLLIYIVNRFDKVTFVSGTFFIITSSLSVLRQTDRISLNVEIPILIILTGFLLLIARRSEIPNPNWLLDLSKGE